jgi:hypothetical protein
MTYLATFAGAVVVLLAAWGGIGLAAHRAGHLVVMDFRQSGLLFLEYRGNGRFALIGAPQVPLAALRYAGRAIAARMPRLGRGRRFFPAPATAPATQPTRLAHH